MTIPTNIKLTFAVALLSAACQMRVLAEQKPDSTENTAVVARYNGVTYDEALAQFQSELTPTTRIKSLDTLVQFAIRNHHAEEVASLIVEEGRTLPVEIFSEIQTYDRKALLREAFDALEKRITQEPANSIDPSQVYSIDELKYWQSMLRGVSRIALPQRKTFEQRMVDQKCCVQSRILAGIAVLEADCQMEPAARLLKVMPAEPTPAAAIKVHDILLVEVDEKANVVDHAQPLDVALDSEQTTYRIGAVVVDIFPNGNLLLEGRKTYSTNDGIFEFRLTGRVQPEDIDPTRTVRSENIAELDITRQLKKQYSLTPLQYLEILLQYLP